jgi:hypothetical protein
MIQKKSSFLSKIFLFSILITFYFNSFAQNQKTWNGNTSGFRIDTTVNAGSQVTWILTLGAGSTSSKLDGGGRSGLTTVTWGNTTAAMIRDTIKAFETLDSCTSNLVNKPIDVYPKPIVSVSNNDTLCIGSSLGTQTLTVSNYAIIGGASNLGEFNITYELRSGSTSGTNVLGTPVILTTTTGSISLTSIPTASLSAGTYYLVITGFASNLAATASNLAPGSYAGGNAPATIAAIPTNYAIHIRPAITTPAIQAY